MPIGDAVCQYIGGSITWVIFLSPNFIIIIRDFTEFDGHGNYYIDSP